MFIEWQIRALLHEHGDGGHDADGLTQSGCESGVAHRALSLLRMGAGVGRTDQVVQVRVFCLIELKGSADAVDDRF